MGEEDNPAEDDAISPELAKNIMHAANTVITKTS
jgi:hypothetical protein